MARICNIWSFYLLLVCIGLSSYAIYSNIKNTWLISPPSYVLLLFSVIAFIAGIIGFGAKMNWQSALRSWFTVIISFLLSLLLIGFLCLIVLGSMLGGLTYLETAESPDGKYEIDFYRWDAGAAGTFGIRGELNGPLWFKKRIYLEKRVEDITVEWIDNHTVSINNHVLRLNQGDTYGY